ncbi:MAG TPA: AraC family transcriptional regulator [Usitatibacter sp.]|jgi:AraC-like DNA-binding protein|nr:AraC family transcriptional regulator [Usitatibacter sp.]
MRSKALPKEDPPYARQEKAGEYFEWSTDQVPVTQRLDSYVGHLCEHLMNVTASSQERSDFRARITTAELAGLSVSAMSGSQQDSRRTRSHIAATKEHAYHLVLARCPWKLSLRESTLHLRPGDLVLADTRYEYSAHWPTDCHALNVRLPTEWVQGWIAEPRQLVGQVISCESGWGKVLSSYVSAIPPEVAVRPPVAAKVMADQVGALLALAASETPGCAAQGAPTYPLQYARILRCIEDRCAELELTASDIAATTGVSARTVHRILASFGQTFGKKLMDARMEVAKRMLDSRSFSHVTTAEIGRRAGFLDASHFARVFRSQLGLTPRQYRELRVPG